jgi:tRNA threonylcarbamoyladenosine biosynthesis protein TsaE
MVICLKGDLGTGKTVFTKGFAQAMEIKEEITSPTFNIIKEYTSGELPLYHMDVYRLDGKVDNLGIEEYYTKKGVTIIEWADIIEDKLTEERLDINFKVVNEDTRVLTLVPHGQQYEDVVNFVL